MEGYKILENGRIRYQKMVGYKVPENGWQMAVRYQKMDCFIYFNVKKYIFYSKITVLYCHKIGAI